MGDEAVRSAVEGELSGELGELGAYGDCGDCGVRHALPQGRARLHALEVMEEFRRLDRLDYRASESDADPKLRFQSLFAARGNMFGVLECVDKNGRVFFLRAFSSLAEGIRDVEGWVLPILSASVYEDIILPAQAEIKRLTGELEGGMASSPGTHNVPGAKAERALLDERRRVSRELWDQMCSLYRFRNFRGEERRLREAVLPDTPITGGMGECCAPKLLQHAALNGLRPLSIAEFYWGATELSADLKPNEDRAESGSISRRARARGDRVRAKKEQKQSGEFYPSCEARCQPLLGFMLCGVET